MPAPETTPEQRRTRGRKAKRRKPKEIATTKPEVVRTDGPGRPPMYSSAKDLQDKIDEYFLVGRHNRKMVSQLGVEYEVPFITTTDLALYLGFASRQSLWEYGQRPEFTYAIKRALTFIERDYEEALKLQNATGAIFALKNFGWKDRIEIDIKQELAPFIEAVKNVLIEMMPKDKINEAVDRILMAVENGR